VPLGSNSPSHCSAMTGLGLARRPSRRNFGRLLRIENRSRRLSEMREQARRPRDEYRRCVGHRYDPPPALRAAPPGRQARAEWSPWPCRECSVWNASKQDRALSPDDTCLVAATCSGSVEWTRNAGACVTPFNLQTAGSSVPDALPGMKTPWLRRRGLGCECGVWQNERMWWGDRSRS
jgi:hypothetical protein